MKHLATATIRKHPLTRKRLATIPRRINGLYRLSVTSREPFEVGIGARWLSDARTLDVFHEVPMFIDGIENVGAVDVWSSGGVSRVMQIFPAGRPAKLEFRITAYDVMPERDELESTKKLASVQTPLVYEGLAKHSYHALREATAEAASAVSGPSGALDVAARIVAVGLLLGLGGALASGLLGMTALAVAAAAAPPACCPSRTYVNGRLFKNLKEVKVKLNAGRVTGYASP